jgi:hypothetical protein
MPNGTSTPFGFRPYRHLLGGTPNRTREFPIASGYATTLGQGDPVKLLSDGTIAKAAAGDRMVGVFIGVQYVDSSGNAQFTNRWPASATGTNIKASVIADPFVTFEVQSNKASAPDQTDIGLLADHVVGTASSIHGGSTAYLSATQATGIAQWRIVGLIEKPGNSGIYATVEVAAVEHEYILQPATLTGTAGV